jgi:site-specific DNA recombinase
VKAVSLLRVSSAGQTKRAGAAEGYSLPVQREACERKAHELKATIVREFVAPAESASNGIYRTLKDAVDYVGEQRDIDFLIVYQLDRLIRDELGLLTVFADLRTSGCRLISVLEPMIDDSPMGMLMLTIMGGVNAFRSRNDAQKIKDNLRKKAAMGGTPKRVRLGYKNVRTWDGANDIRTVELDDERMPHIKWAFTAFSTGEYTINELVEEAWERGLRTRPTPTRPAGKVSRSTFAALLKDPYYIGVVRYAGVDYEGTHPTFIDAETFGRVQQVLETHHLAGEKHWRHSHHLKGTVYCGYCGKRLRFTQVRGRRGGLYRYFVCSTRHSGDPCEQAYLAEHRVEDAIARYYASTVRFDAERLARLESALTEAFGSIIEYRCKQVDIHRRLVAKLEAKRRLLLDAHLDGAVPVDLLAEKQRDIAEKLAVAQAKIAAAERSNESAMRGVELARKLMHKAGDAYDEADAITQRAWNQAFFKRLFVKPLADGEPEVVGAELTDPFGRLLAEDLATVLEQMPEKAPAALAAGGSNVDQIVETAGIEPASAIA